MLQCEKKIVNWTAVKVAWNWKMIIDQLLEKAQTLFCLSFRPLIYFFSKRSALCAPHKLRRSDIHSYRISRGGGVGRRVFFADMSFGSKREINWRTLYPVPALRGLKRCKTHVRPKARLLPMWWRQVCYHCRSSTLLMMWELQFASSSQEVSKKRKIVIQTPFFTSHGFLWNNKNAPFV